MGVVSLKRVSQFSSHDGQIFNVDSTFSSQRQIPAVGFASIYGSAYPDEWEGRCHTEIDPIETFVLNGHLTFA